MNFNYHSISQIKDDIQDDSVKESVVKDPGETCGRSNKPSSETPIPFDMGIVTVREHSRKKPLSGKCKKVPKKVPSMDIASFKSIILIQQDTIDYYKKKNIDNSNHKKTRDTWKEFWNGAKLAKKRRKPKYVWKSKENEAKKSEKRFLKAINDFTKPMTKKDWDSCPR